MRIAVNTRLLLPGRLEGIGWFTYENLKRITRAHPQHEFIFIFDRKPSTEFIFDENVKAVVAHPQARHPVLWFLFFELGVYRILKKYKPDVFLSPDGWLSLRSKVKSVAVIHDLNFEAHPEFLPKHIVWYYKWFFPRFAKKATRIATVSQFTKRDLHQRYGVELEKIDVVYNGANIGFKSMQPAEVQKVRDKVAQGAPYFLFVGLIHPRKNLENQLRAFEVFKSQTGSNHKFIVVGAMHWTSPGLENTIKNSRFKNDIVFMGRLEMKALTEIYGAAFAVMYVSFYEGFGIPILEAFHAEVPIITSTTSCMPEISGGAALTANPKNIQDIADAMILLARDKNLRVQLIEKGKLQREKYSWNKTATALWSTILKATEKE